MELFVAENINLTGTATSKDAALGLVAEFAAQRGYATDPAGVLAGLQAREAQVSTALMDGIAIPHTKHEAVLAPALVVLRLDQPVDWGDQPIQVMLGMLIPEAQAGTTHLTLLAQVSRALIEEDIRQALRTGDRDEIYAALSGRIA